MIATYSPFVFDVSTVAHAKAIILTQEDERTTDERWEIETPYFLDLIGKMNIKPEHTVLDYGCGIGRLSKGMIDRFGCKVLGVDISASMREMAIDYVASDCFMVCHPDVLHTFGDGFDAAIAVWVLQHCFKPKEDIARIRNAVKRGGQVLVVNNIHRALPTVEYGWADDGVSIRQLLGVRFDCAEEGPPDARSVGDVLNRNAFWARFNA